jgi:hypothetical protein
MPSHENAHSKLPADFAERSAGVNARIEAGEPMTFQSIADQLGLPFEVFARCLGAYARSQGIPFTIDCASLPTHH